MEESPIHIKFVNHHNPQARFDLIKLEDIFGREFSDHSPFEHHLVEFYILLVFEKGEGKHTIDFQDYACKPGTVLTVRKDQIHKFYRTPGVKAKGLLFTDGFLVSYLEKLEALKSLQLFNEILGSPKIQLTDSGFSEVQQQLERIETEYFNLNDDYSLGIIRSELHILIAKLFRLKADDNKTIRNRKYLSEFISFQNLVEKNASQLTQVKEYAIQLGMSTKTLNTITKTVVHKSAKNFIDDIRTKQIKRILINTELSVKEIAYRSGFEETTNFYKYFKRQTQLTPEQFRASF